MFFKLICMDDEHVTMLCDACTQQGIKFAVLGTAVIIQCNSLQAVATLQAIASAYTVDLTEYDINYYKGE